MFGLFKTSELREKEGRVDEIGRDLFRQYELFRDLVRAGVFSDEITQQRINAAFTAAYELNFIKEGLAEIFNEEKKRQKYLERVCYGVSGKNVYTLVMSKLAARELGADTPNWVTEELKHKLDSFNKEYDAGIFAAKMEYETWKNNKTYKPHMLFDYLKTGQYN